MTKEEIRKVLDLALEYYKLEIYGTGKESEPPTEARIDWIYERMKPSLPSDLDEAAEEYIKFKPRYDIQQELEEGEDPTEIDCFTIDAAIDIFKAGAEWLAGKEYADEVKYSDLEDRKYVFVPYEEFNPGDKVIVQIRKKQ